jgi:MATE family multidrug resistance protein
MILTNIFDTGMSFAMDTLVSQAYGARNFKFIGVVFQNALVVVSAMFIPIALAFWFTEPMLILLKQDIHLAKMAGQYNRWLIPGILPLLIYRAQCQYLQNQRILAPAMFSGAVSVVLSIPANYILIYKGFGFIGAPMAGSFTWTIQPILLWAYVSWTGVHRQSWAGCDLRKAFDKQNLLTFLKLGIPSSAMLALEVVGFEIATIFVGTFGDVSAVKAHSIGFNLTTWVFIIPIGFAIGSTTRVGNRLGEGNSAGAKFSALVGFLVIGSILLFICTFMLALKSYIPLIYSNSPQVVAICKKLMPWVAILAFLDGAQTFTGALMRSVGRPLAGSIVSFLGYYLMAIPIGAGLAWGAKWKIFGVWTGLVAGLAGAVIGYAVLIYRVDWEKEAVLARERVNARQEEESVLDQADTHESSDDLVALELASRTSNGLGLVERVDNEIEIDSYPELDSSEPLVELEEDGEESDEEV